MKSLLFLTIISVISIGMVGHAEAEIIELKTDKSSYDNNDSNVVISGEIADRLIDRKTDVGVQIFSPFFDNALGTSITSEINSDNTFSIDFPISKLAKIKELHRGETATYTVVVSDKFERTSKSITFDFFNDVPRSIPMYENEHGLYTKNKLQTQTLEVGEEVQIVFVIREEMIGDTVKAIATCQVQTTPDAAFDTKDSAEFRFGSLDSNKIRFPFTPQNTGVFFLEQEILYSHDDGFYPISDSSGIQFHVVEKFSRAANEDGLCKKSEMVSLLKPDLFTNVCVTPQTAKSLTARWY